MNLETVRFMTRMVQEWTNNVFYVDLSRFGTVWSPIGGGYGASFGDFWPFLAILAISGPKISLR